MKRQNEKISPKESCPRCRRPRNQCFCGKITCVENETAVLILQHPRERNKLLNSARLSAEALCNCALRTGLSWPNLSAALGQRTNPSSWGVLYLDPHAASDRPLFVRNRKNQPVEALEAIAGIVVLDGSWKQAKSMWWRNPWLLKLNRIHLNPREPSVRRQSRNQALSTAESIAFALRSLGECEHIWQALERAYQAFIVEPNRELLETISAEERSMRGRGRQAIPEQRKTRTDGRRTE